VSHAAHDQEILRWIAIKERADIEGERLEEERERAGLKIDG
jgi:hypothetical protein